MTHPITKARFRPMIDPIFPPVTISIAMTSVYSTMAVWMPVIVVPRSSATVAIETFMTEESSAIKNCAAHSVIRTLPAAFCATDPFDGVDMFCTLGRPRGRGEDPYSHSIVPGGLLVTS